MSFVARLDLGGRWKRRHHRSPDRAIVLPGVLTEDVGKELDLVLDAIVRTIGHRRSAPPARRSTSETERAEKFRDATGKPGAPIKAHVRGCDPPTQRFNELTIENYCQGTDRAAPRG
jgi:hypothetical protein